MPDAIPGPRDVVSNMKWWVPAPYKLDSLVPGRVKSTKKNRNGWANIDRKWAGPANQKELSMSEEEG